MIGGGLLRKSRGRGAAGSHGPLTLVPMIDILTIMVVYLLVHAADAEILSNPRNVAIPMSATETKPRESTVITVTRDMLYVDGREIVALAEIGPGDGAEIEPLRTALSGHGPADATGAREVTVIADKSLRYPVLRRIIASCGAADYTKVSLAVAEREQVLASLPGS